jgi:hypothetical protein
MGSETERRLGAKEVGGILQKSDDWMRKARRVPGMGPPFYRIGSRYQYSLSDLREWMKQKVGG